MCGIAGFITGKSDVTVSDLQAMTDSLTERGPDDVGIALMNRGGLQIGLGHRRLSIIDLSNHGKQPMTSRSGRFRICYNGEVYNYRELRTHLIDIGHIFTGNSDTEVILAAVEEWGLRNAVEKFNGMFAFALWDDSRRIMHLCRDRIGIKPLYYGQVGHDIVFASQLKAFRKYRHFNGEVDINSAALFFRYSYIPAPYSIYKNVRKLEPGSILSIDCSNSGEPRLQHERYWNLGEYWSKDAVNNDGDIQNEIEGLLSDSVEKRMISDVPLGAFLSGGIDSSLIAAIMQKHSTKPIKTFTIGFDEDKYNEAQYAKATAQHLGTDHTELYLSPRDLLEVIPEIPSHWDEPFSDASQIPTLLLSKMTRQHVTVALSGDGGDELFAGYNRYPVSLSWSRTLRIPSSLRKPAGNIITSILNFADRNMGIMTAKRLSWRADLLQSDSIYDYLMYMQTNYRQPEDLVHDCDLPYRKIPMHELANTSVDDLSMMQQWDMLQYLPDDILVKVDRASMAVGLEARVPLLDHRIIEAAAKIPRGLKMDGDTRKIILRNILYKYVPQDMVDRPKQGFGIPLNEWLGHELRDWAEELMDEKKMKEHGILNTATVRKMWDEFLLGRTRWGRTIWDILMMEAWLRS